MKTTRSMLTVVMVIGVIGLAAGAASAATLVDEDFQSPLYLPSQQNPSFTGWTWTNGNATWARNANNQSDVPGSQTIPNQVVQLEWDSAEMVYDISQGWSTSEVYTLTLNASPQSWNGAADRYIAPSLLQQDNTVLWSANTMMPKYNNFGRNPWTADQTFTYTIDPNAFTTGTEGSPLRLKIDHTGQRGIYVDNVLLESGPPPTDTTPPTPDPMTWEAEPAVFDYTSIGMIATTAVDPYGQEYFFENTVTGASSGWRDSTTWMEHELDSNTLYTYRNKARDKSPNQNETQWSSEVDVTTPAAPPGLIFSSGFQFPMYSNGTANPDFYGWTYTNSGALRSRTAPSDGTPGDPQIPNQVIQSEWNTATATRDTSHPWSADEVYTLTLNVSPQEWHGQDDRFFKASLSEQGGPVLWTSGDIPLPKYDDFAGNPWTAAQTFTFEIDASTFTAGTEGGLLSVKIESTGSRGIYFDNVMLTFAGPQAEDVPEPATMAALGLAVAGLGGYVRKRRRA